MKSANRRTISGLFTTIQRANNTTTELHEIMLKAERIRLAHASGEISAEEAANRLSELYNGHRFQSHRRGDSLLSA